MRIAIAFSVLVLLTASAGHAEDRSDGCADAVDQSQLNACAEAALKKSDAELNALYGQIKERLKGNADSIKLLTAAQRSWLAFRDSECAFAASSVSGGSVYPSILAGCLDRLTTDRITDFETYLACKEGDLACPVPAAQ